MTVVELDEWIPSEQFAMKKDNITDALFGVIYAKFPSSALGHHGILIRLLSSNEETKGKDRFKKITHWPKKILLIEIHNFSPIPINLSQNDKSMGR